jgi:G-patch domain
MTTSKVSFTIRRPTPVSRAPSSGPDSDSSSSFKVPSLPRHLTLGSPLTRSVTSSPKPHEDSSDEDDELVTEFDRFGAQRCVSVPLLPLQSFQLTKATRHRPYYSLRNKASNQAPLIIPAQQNRDWRDLARKRRSAAQYIPASAKAQTGLDGSVGGLGVKDTINSGPVLSGLQVKVSQTVKQEDNGTTMVTEDVKIEEDEETEDQRALQAILAETNGIKHEGPIVDIIPTPISEAEAYKQDVDELPDVATLDDYARIPVSQFGAALLRGMGWKEGTAATRKSGKGLVEPYLPAARPALLGIGAKEREVLDDGSRKKVVGRPEKRYVPVIKKERDDRPSSAPAGRNGRERSRSPRQRNGVHPATTSRQSSPGRRRDDDRHRERRGRDYEREERYRDSPRGDRDRERGRDRSREASRRRRD